MPRAGGIYSPPPGTDGVPNTPIESAKYNAFVADITADQNAPRPITAGGTGGTSAVSGNDGLNTTSSDMASAATLNLANATGVTVNVTGTTTITALGTVNSGALRTLVFAGALTLTHNATSLILPGAANITTAAGDVATFRSKGAGNWVCVGYQKATGGPTVSVLVNPTITGNVIATSTDAGATGGPDLEVYRDSASPAASDVIGRHLYTGRDSAANKQTYAVDQAVILDATSGSEDAKRVTRTVVAGVEADRLHVGAGAWMEGATGGDPGAGQFNATGLEVNGVNLYPRVLGTATATTSGTAIDFTGIPATVTQIVVSLMGVSTNGTSNLIVQLGDSGGIETTGYLGGGITAGTTANFTTGLGVTAVFGAAFVYHGSIIITLAEVSTNTWVSAATGGFSNSAAGSHCGCSKSTSAVLDRIRLTTVNGTDTFDLGKVNILYQ